MLLFTLIVRPLYNIGYVGYFELNIDSIVENYCVNKEKPELQCNGKCHLATQLGVKSNSSNKASILGSLFEAFVPVFFETYKSISFYNYKSNTKLSWCYNGYLTIVFIDQFDPPPQV
jgi:hypothetical protein